MTSLSTIVSSLTREKKIIISELPSMGIFYNDDFEIYIYPCSLEIISEMESNIDRDDISSVILWIRLVVMNCSRYENGNYDDLKSIDLIWLYIEICKLTINDEVYVHIDGKKYPVNSSTFNYFDYSKFDINKEERVINYNGYIYSLPSVGVERCLYSYIILNKELIEKDICYDFIFFVKNRNYLTNKEIENLIVIYNDDIDDKQKEEITNVKSAFKGFIIFSIKVDGVIHDIKSKLDLTNVMNILLLNDTI